MRFVQAHKLTSYLMVLCAYFALTLSGEISTIITMLSLLCVVGSWLWEPPRIRFERFTIAWTVVSLLVLVYALFSVFTGGDFLLIGAEFLLYLLIAKLFNRRACKDYLHIYIITFLMLVAGTVLNSEFTYGVFFLGYVISATWALILFHLRREMEDNFLLKHSDHHLSERVEVTRILNSRRIVGKRFFVGTSLVSLTIFLVASLLFLAIPRIGFGLFFQKSRGGITMAGFSDGVVLGGHGTIKTDDTVVMRVQVEEGYQGRGAPYIHWRGVAFDRYKKGQWMRTDLSPKTNRQMWYPKAGIEQHHLLYTGGQKSIDDLLSRTEAGVRQEIYLEPIGYDVLFGASMPLAFEFESKLGLRSPRTERNDEMRFYHTSGVKYVVYSEIRSPKVSDMRAATNEELPEGYDAYLDVPDEVTGEVKELAREITKNATTDYDKAVAVESWLKSNLSYTLEMESPGDTEPIHFFLFDRRKGHCEYFSSAMAILLRAVGVPTRNVNGFLGGEWNEYNDYIAVRAGDAHSWVEVYFHGVGWVTFDPTPSADLDQLGRGGDSVSARMRRFMDTMRFQWFKWIIEYDLYQQVSLFRRVRQSLSGSASSVKSVFAGMREFLSEHREVILGSVAGTAALIMGILWWRRRPQALAFGNAKRTRDPVAILYGRVLVKLSRRGHRREPTMTPREYAAKLASLDVPGAKDFGELTELYYHAVYGGHGSEQSASMMTRAQELSAAIEQAYRNAKRAGAA